MKRLLLLLTLLPVGLAAQETDTAHMLIERYVTMLNYDALPQDSMLVMETTISYLDRQDTFVMRRWFTAPNMLRVEVWRGDSLTTGFCTNGTTRFREYSAYNGWWVDRDSADFTRLSSPYDFRGALYRWRETGTQFTYTGTTTLNGQPLAAVLAEQLNMYSRYYLFEVRSGLLLFIIETDTMPSGSTIMGYSHSKWKAFHEYLPVGASLLPSEESYLRDDLLTIMRTTARFVPRDNTLFNRDNR